MTPGQDEPDVADLTTSGRITGTPHLIEIWFAMGEGCVYLLSGEGDRSDWVRNIMVAPDVILEIGDRKRHVRARVLSEGSEGDTLARALLAAKYTARGHANLEEWGRRALAVEIDWPD